MLNVLDIKTKFINYFYNELKSTKLFTDLANTVENSPWHREQNVAIHTDMVVAQYIGLAPAIWHKQDLLGALACAFHDFGKPIAEELKVSEERGEYRSYSGHEVSSARVWEDYAITNWKALFAAFNLTLDDVYTVSWIIEHHLPYALKKQVKLNYLRTTVERTVGLEVYFNCLKADARGRLSDDYPAKLAKVDVWCASFAADAEVLDLNDDPYNEGDEFRPTLYVLIGPSGCGKSTYTAKLKVGNPTTTTFSLDALRLDWYDSNDYSNAWKLSVEDTEFSNKADKSFAVLVAKGEDIVLDNTNTTQKSRRKYIDQARRRGYAIAGVVFPSTRVMVCERQNTRTDKSVPISAVLQQYDRVQMPSYGEVDTIKSVCTFE